MGACESAPVEGRQFPLGFHLAMLQRLGMCALRSAPRTALHVASGMGWHQLRGSVRTLATLCNGENQDVVIVGAGVVGLAMLAGLVSDVTLPPLRVTMVDAMDVHRFGKWHEMQQARTAPASDAHDGVPWENRVISMNMDNLSWLDQIGAYKLLEQSRLRAIKRIRVWDGLTGAATEFGAEQGALSNMVEISNVQQALYRYVAARAPASRVDVRIVDKAKVVGIEADGRDAWPHLTYEVDGRATTLATRLLVGADGGNSPVRRFAGIESFGWPYHCKGLVATLRSGLRRRSAEPIIDTSAWQRFLPTGTLACLPLSPTSATVVWALPPQLADALAAMHRSSGASDDGTSGVLAALISAGFRLDWPTLERFLYATVERAATTDWAPFEAEIYAAVAAAEEAAGDAAPSAHTGAVPPWADAVDVRSVASFPLQLKHAGCYLGSTLNQGLNRTVPTPSTALGALLTALGLTPGGAARGCGQGRTVLVGDAAHTTHPLAGQGLNLGLQDVRALCAALNDACAHGMDIGTHSALQPYERARYLPNQAMLSVTDHLHWLFAIRPNSTYAPSGPLREAALRALVWARSTGLDVVNELSPIKKLLAANAGSIRV